MRIRRALPDDADAVASVFIASFASLLSFLPRLHTHDEDRAFIAGLVQRAEVWLAEAGDDVIGFVAIAPAQVEQLYVHPGHQRRGVGGALLAKAKERQAEGFTLWVFQQNEQARRFYEKHDLKLVKLTDGSGNEERTPDALYEWRPPA